jgi:hypothetical protein
VKPREKSLVSFNYRKKDKTISTKEKINLMLNKLGERNDDVDEFSKGRFV